MAARFDAFLKSISTSIADNLIAPLSKALADQAGPLADALAEKAVPRLEDAVITEFEKHIPELTEALVRAVVTSMSDMVARTEDRLTDMIPGQLDDQVDGIVKNILGGLFGTNT